MPIWAYLNLSAGQDIQLDMDGEVGALWITLNVPFMDQHTQIFSAPIGALAIDPEIRILGVTLICDVFYNSASKKKHQHDPGIHEPSDRICQGKDI